MRLAIEGQMIEKAKDIFKDPNISEFTGFSELENKIIDNLKSFLLELGRGFIFIGRQVRFTFLRISLRIAEQGMADCERIKSHKRRF